MNPFKAIGRAVTAPFKGVKKGVNYVQNQIYIQVGLLIARHALTALGVSGVLSDDDMSQLAGAVATTIGLGWSAWRKIARARSGDGRP